MPRSRFAVRTLGAFAALVLVSCFGDGTGPGELRPGRISLIPSFDQQAANLVDFDEVHIVLTRPGATTPVLDTVIPFPAGADSLILSFTVDIGGASEQLTLVMELIDQPSGNVVFTVGPTTVTATAGGSTAQPLPPFIYVGPGANAAGVRFVTTASEVFFLDSVALSAEAFDGQGNTMTGVPIRWTSSDTSRAILRTDSTGRVVAKSVRGPVTISASLLRTSPTTAPPAVTQAVAVQPRPSTIAVQSGNAQTGAVGAALPQQVTARVLASDNLGVQGVVVTFAVATGGGSLAALVDTTDGNGDARTTWTLGTAVGAQSVTATVPGVAGATVNFGATGSPAAPASLEFFQGPTTASEGAIIAPPVTVRARDAFGNLAVLTGNVTLNLLNAGAAVLGGNQTRTAVAGVATFNDLTVNVAGTGYQLRAASGTLAPDTSAPFDITLNAATQLTFDVQPTNAVADQAITPPIQVALRTAGGVIVTTSTAAVTLAIGNNPGGAVLGGTTTVNAVAGIATFTGITLDRVGTGYTLAATSGVLPAVASASFAIAAGPATVLTFSGQPPAATIFQSPFALTVTALDAGGNVATGFGGDITVSIAANPSAGTLAGTLTQTAVAGVANFTGLSIDNIGNGYTLAANATGVAGVASNPIDVQAPATVRAWINPAGGNWSNAANWAQGIVPTATDTVFIRQSGTYTVTLDVSATVARLDVGAPSGNQTLQINANTLTMAGDGAFTTRGILNLAGGQITGAGTLDVAGPFNWSGGSLTGGGGTLRVSGVLSVTGSGAGRQLNSYTLEQAGNGTWATTTAAMSSGSSGTLRVLAGQTLDVRGDFGIQYNQGGVTSRLVVLGAMQRSTSAGVVSFTTPVDNGGLVVAQTGTLSLDGGGTSSGAYGVSAGATLRFGGGTHTVASVSGAGTSAVSGGTVTASAAWTVDDMLVTAGSVTINGGYAAGTSTQVSGGTLTFNAPVGHTTGSLTLSGGSIGGTGSFVVNGPMDWSGGSLGGSGGTLVVNGVLSVTGSGAGRALNSYTLEAGGGGTWATTTAQMSSGSSGTLRVAAGTFDVTGDFGIQFNQGGAISRLVVLGTLRRTTSANPVTFGTTLEDSGAVDIQTGTFVTTGGGASSGAVTVATGALLNFAGGTYTLGTGTTIGGGGGVQVTGGTVSAAGTWTLADLAVSAGTVTMTGGYSATGTTVVSGGTANFSSTSSSPSLTLSGGTLGGSGLLTVAGAGNWSGGNLSGGGGTLRVNGLLSVSGSAAGRQLNSYTLEAAGGGTWATTTALMSSGSSGTLRVLAGQTLDVTGDFGIQFNQGGAISRLVVLGTLRRTTSANPVTFGTTLEDSGAVDIQTGTFVTTGGGASSGAVTVATGALLNFAGGTYTLGTGTTIGGGGGVQVTGGTVSAAGTWTLADLAVSAGTVTMTGGYSATGTTVVSGGTANFSSTSSSPSLTLSGGTLGGSGLLTVAGAGNWSGGNLSGGGGTLRVNGLLSVSGSAAGRQLNSYTLEAAGGGTWATTTALMSSGSSGTLRVLAGQTLDVTGDFGIQFNQGGAISRLVVLGTLRRTTSANPVTFGTTLEDSGAVDIQTGTFVTTGGGASSGAVTVATGALLNFAGGTYTLGTGTTIGGGGGVQVTGGTVSAAGTWTLADLAVSAGTVTMTGGYSATGTTVVSGGTANFSSTSSSPSLTLSGGTIGGSGLLTVAGAFNWSGGNLSGGGGTLRANGPLNVTGSGAGRALNSYTLEAAGGGTWATTTVQMSSGSSGTLRVAAGTFDVTGDFGIQFNQGGAISRLVVLGTLRRTTSANPVTFGTTLEDSGAVDIQTGTFVTTGGGASSGAVTVATGALLNFAGGTYTLGTGTTIGGGGGVQVTGGTVSAAGTWTLADLAVSAGTVTMTGGYSATGTTVVSGGTANFSSTSSSPSLTLSGGTLGGSGLLTVAGAFNWSGGNLSGGGGTLRANGPLNVTGSGAGRALNSYTLEAAGGGTWATTTVQMSSGSSGTLRVVAGTFDVTGDFGIQFNQGGAISRLVVLGTLRRTTSTGAVEFSTAVHDSGSVDVQSGALHVTGGGVSSGTFAVAAGATLRFDGTHTLAAASTVNGAGTVLVTGGSVSAAAAWSVTDVQVSVGSVTFSGGYSASGTTTVSSGGATFNSAATQTTGSLTLSGGTIAGTGLLTVSGPMSWSGGNLSGGAGTVRVLNTGTFAGSTAAARNLNNYTLELAGNGSWAPVTTLINSGSSGTLRVLSGATFDVQGGLGISFNQGGAPSLFDNQGAVTITGTGAFVVNVPFTGGGSYSVATTGALDLQGGGTISGPVALAGGGILVNRGNTTTFSGTLTGSGTLNLTGGTLNFTGASSRSVLAVNVSGGTLGVGPNLEVTGNLATTGTGALSMTNAADSLDIGGNASFGGAAGALSNGVIRLKGNFAQSAGAATYSPTASHRLVMDGSVPGTKTIQFTNPTTSFFRRLFLDKQPGSGQTIQLLSNVLVTDSMVVSGGTDMFSSAPNRLAVQGVFRYAGGVNNPIVRPFVLEANANALNTLDSVTGPPTLSLFLPDTLVLLGTTATIPFANYVKHRSIRLSTTGNVTYFAGGINDTLLGDLVVTSGRFQVTGPLSVQKFKTQGTGGFEMNTPGIVFTVRDSAVIAGGSNNPFLNAGTLRLQGNLVQAGSAASLNGDPPHTVEFAGSGAQTVFFTNPGYTPLLSHFGVVRFANTGPGVTFLTDVLTHVLEDVTTGTQEQVNGGGFLLTAEGVNVDNLLFDNTRVSLVDNQTFTRFDNVAFQNYPTNPDMLTIARSANPPTLAGLTFSTAGTGRFLVANEVGGGPLLAVTLTGATPGPGSLRCATTAGATISWNGGAC